MALLLVTFCVYNAGNKTDYRGKYCCIVLVNFNTYKILTALKQLRAPEICAGKCLSEINVQ